MDPESSWESSLVDGIYNNKWTEFRIANSAPMLNIKEKAFAKIDQYIDKGG